MAALINVGSLFAFQFEHIETRELIDFDLLYKNEMVNPFSPALDLKPYLIGTLKDWIDQQTDPLSYHAYWRYDTNEALPLVKFTIYMENAASALMFKLAWC